MSRIALYTRRKNVEPPTSRRRSMLLPARAPPVAISGIGCTLLGTEVRRHWMSQVQGANVSGRAAAVRGSPLSGSTPNRERERDRGAYETVEPRGADKSTPLSASPLQGQSFALPDSKESNRHCGSSYRRPPDYIAVATGSLCIVRRERRVHVT